MRKYITKHDWKRCPMPFASANKKNYNYQGAPSLPVSDLPLPRETEGSYRL